MPGVELAVALALHQRNDFVPGVRLHIGKAAEIGEVERAVAERLDGRVVAGRDDELDRGSNRLFQLVSKRRLFVDRDLCRARIRNHPDPHALLRRGDQRYPGGDESDRQRDREKQAKLPLETICHHQTSAVRGFVFAIVTRS